MKKSKLEKRISKLESKVESFESRFYKTIDTGKGENTQCYTINKLNEDKELTELPEKWCVFINDDVLPYLNIHGVNAGKYNSIDKGSYAHFPKINNSFSTALTVKDGYTEISLSDFERLVLKKEESKDIEAGKWYKKKSNKFLFFISKIDGNKALGYGFSSIGYWFNNYSDIRLIERDCHLATTQEVEEDLKNEAVKRGFKKGVTFKSASSGDEFIFNGNFHFHKSINSLTGEMGCIFYEGIWAEIVQDNHDDVYVKGVWDEFLKKEIDWSIPGQKVIGNQEVIVLTSGDFDLSKEIFSGIIIKTGGCVFPVGYYSKNWDSKHFKLHTNPVTL